MKSNKCLRALFTRILIAPTIHIAMIHVLLVKERVWAVEVLSTHKGPAVVAFTSLEVYPLKRRRIVATLRPSRQFK